MSRSRPYQPSLLRLLHGVNALIALLAIITSFWVYNTYDGRFGKVPLPQINDIIGIHGTFGVIFLFIMPALALYSFHLGQKRLVQPDSFQKLTQVGKPIWWYSLHRIMNTWMLLAATFALITGRMMKEEWLPVGELNHIWYSLHLIGWVVLVSSFAIHLLMVAKVGGVPLIVSMFDLKYRPEDSPTTWFQKIRSLLRRSQV
ncbi:MAG: cytochrome b/b6 domain-containing protein [Coleofasciculus sp. S288]|nr:cytochrome b/b6 domain-containing protein [Coleofasciculus sp. S288]